MKRETFCCACCKRYLLRNSRSRNQRYCGSKKCQQARKNEWQRRKMVCDWDYRADKKDSQQTWQKKNKDYWKKYRRKHPVYEQRNRELQKERDRHRLSAARGPQAPSADLAKKDALSAFFNSKSNSYFLTPTDPSLAKKDALMVQIIPFSKRYTILQRRTR